MAPAAINNEVIDRPTAILSPTSKIVIGDRTLLLCPPSISSNPTALENILSSHSRSNTDVQMLDRLALGMVHLPANAYTQIILLSDPASSNIALNSSVIKLVADAMTPGSTWRTQDQNSTALRNADTLQVLLAGLVIDENDGNGLVYTKPAYSSTAAIPLKLGKRKTVASPAVGIQQPKLAQQDQSSITPSTLNVQSNGNNNAGGYKVGFVDFGDDLDADFGEDDDDELIDENTLLDESDLATPIQQPPECRPKTGKRRRACKDCTCGLREKLEEEDSTKRATADATLASKKLTAIKLVGDDLAEVDFTVEGKASSCGSCYLGDAFRCDGCPYIGLPAFKPGEQVQIPLGDDQF